MTGQQLLLIGLFMLLIGCGLAMLIRWQLAYPVKLIKQVHSRISALQKPYTKDILSPKVRQLLEK